MGHLSDCDKCMQTKTTEQRRLMGCGFEPRFPGAVVWQPPSSSSKAYNHKRPEVCVGYLISLPEVSEVALAHHHWSNSAIEAYCQGQPSEMLLDLVSILDSEQSRVHAWLITPKKDGGGAD